MDDVAIVGVGLHPVRPLPGRDRHRHGRDRDPARAGRRRASSGATSSSRSRAATRSTIPTRSSRCSGSPASRSPTSTTAARPRRARSTLAAQTIRLGDHDLGIAVGMDKHLPGAFTADPRLYACPSWYGELGQFITTKFFGMKINKYMHDHGISHETLAKVAAKNYRNGALNPNAFRRKPLSEEEILASPMLQLPADAVHVLQPRRRGGRGRAVQGRERAPVHRHADLPARVDGADAPARRVRGAQPVAPDRGDRRRRRSTRRVRAYETAGIGPGRRRRDPTPGHRRGRGSDPPRRERLLRRRRAGAARRRRRARDRRLASRQHRRRPDRERRADRRVGPAPSARDRAATARPGRRTPSARQSEGRVHAALRRTRNRGRLDPLVRPDVDTRDTPEQAELRRSARQLARVLAASDGADLDDATRAKRLAGAVRDAGWLELRDDGATAAPLAGGVEAAIVADALGGAVGRRARSRGQSSHATSHDARACAVGRRRGRRVLGRGSTNPAVCAGADNGIGVRDRRRRLRFRRTCWSPKARSFVSGVCRSTACAAAPT